MDWLIPALVVVVYSLQWWAKLNKQLRKDVGRAREPVQKNGTKDDLLEALGLPKTGTRPQSVPPVAPVMLPKSLAEPSHKVTTLPEISHVEFPQSVVEESKPAFAQVMPEEDLKKWQPGVLEEQKNFSAKLISNANIKQASSGTLNDVSESRAAVFANYFRSKSAIRDAIVMNEILQPPLSLRLSTHDF